MPHAIGIDLGGTELRAATVAQDGELLARARVLTDLAGGPAAVIEQMAELVAEVRAGYTDDECLGIGVGCPGPLDSQSGVVLAPPTLPGWIDVKLTQLVGARLGVPVRIENDANAAALGEWRFGAGRGLAHVVYVTVSTGIGGGVILGGRLLQGRRNLAGEVGHMTVSDMPAPCACGNQGCWEALASGSAIGRFAAEALKSEPGSAIAAFAGDEAVSARHVADAARAGDALALRLLRDEARWLAIGFTNLLHVYSPSKIIVGGGVSACLDLMAAEIRQIVAERAMPAYRAVPIARAGLGTDAGVIGAASLVIPVQAV